MKLRVIDGGRASEPAPALGAPLAMTIRAEAARRIEASGYHQWRARSLATGVPIPGPIRYLKLQIDFVAEKLERLNPLPADFTEDKYWPAV
ncbi:hypothetical protein PYH37_004322 [Sinorhizobium numidicum]|uniref:Uncharacterized protein n=1 Tax=Sinorhizobium numidicum TaxID=680248 RepID=A0ABY8CVN9_9HYPH|nr:hypothetical protein [Sinorhizobium numidicum]WEX76055.1 hypothetical protein PYH37_004322 [Sinorhizobium numidicum]WEX82714.1 hypothetical protein PYH38_005034 [Sinorhizobium numidicum]